MVSNQNTLFGRDAGRWGSADGFRESVDAGADAAIWYAVAEGNQTPKMMGQTNSRTTETTMETTAVTIANAALAAEEEWPASQELGFLNLL